MTTFVDGPVRVSVPATSANLGPGYDALGIALARWDSVIAEVGGSDVRVRVSGEGEGSLPLDETHLVVRAMRRGFEAMGVRPSGLSLRCENTIPQARGMGSSSAAIVAGVLAARALVAGGTLLMDDDAVYALAAELEGHPDNVAPALFGGFTIAFADGGRLGVARVAVDPRIQATLFVPPYPVETSVARKMLPSSVPHGDAADNAGRAALLVAALSGQPELLLEATQDRLHQDYREPAMPESIALLRALRADRIPAVLSGAGPTVLAFVDGVDQHAVRARAPQGWQALVLAVERDGARTQVLGRE